MQFFKTIARPATAFALAASVALSPVATKPAQAGNEELFIAGAIGTVLLGTIAAASLNNQNSNGHVRVYTPPKTTRHHGHKPHGHKPRRHVNRRATIPSGCIVRAGGRHTTYYAAQCVHRNYPGAHRLPNYCKTTIINRSRGTRQHLYDGSCLQRAGFPVAGGRGHRR